MNEKRREYKDLGFTDDFMFCKILQSDPELCKEVIETLLDVKIREVLKLDKQELIEKTPDGRGVRLDVYLEGDDAIYDIEMQNQDLKNLPKRARYYQGMIDLNHLKRGDDFNNLRKTFVVFITTFDPFGKNLYRYTFSNTCKEDPSVELGDDSVKVFVNAKGAVDGASPKMREFLEYIETETLSGALSEKIDGKVRTARENKEWEMEFMTVEWKIEEEARKAREEGIREGHAKGLVEGQINAIKVLLNKLTPNEIEDLGFSKLDIEQAKE